MNNLRMLYDLVASSEALNAVIVWIDEHGIGLRQGTDSQWYVCLDLKVPEAEQDWTESYATLTQAMIAMLSRLSHRLWTGEKMP